MVKELLLCALCCGPQRPVLINHNDFKSTEQRIRDVLECRDVPPFTIKLIIAQAKLESGNFTSKLFREHNNLFGMRHPRKRPTKSLGPLAVAEKRRGYASFATIEDSVEDMLLYLWFIGERPYYRTTNQYAATLKRHGYYESKFTHYRDGLLFYKNK